MLSKEDAVNFVLRAFRSAAEREISVGDGVEIWILTKDGASHLHVSNFDEDKVYVGSDSKSSVAKQRAQEAEIRSRLPIHTRITKQSHKLPFH